MMKFNQYILNSKDFAQPILIYLQSVVHKACPEVEEQLKWSFPNFIYKGKILCYMSSFKEHCSFGFWLAPMMADPDKIFNVSNEENTGMGQFGKLKSIKDLPSEKILIKYIKQAMRLIDDGVSLPKKSSKESKPILIPSIVINAFKKDLLAKNNFEKMSPSHQREYIEWIDEAKQESTKQRRVMQMMEWLKESKSRNWKYETKSKA